MTVERYTLYICIVHVHVHVHTVYAFSHTPFSSYDRFRFIQGSKEENCSVSSGFWDIDLEINGVKYIRHIRTRIHSKLDVPVGASYACGQNYHNIYVLPRPENDTNHNNTFGFQFSGLQVCFITYTYMHDCTLEEILRGLFPRLLPLWCEKRVIAWSLMLYIWWTTFLVLRVERGWSHMWARWIPWILVSWWVKSSFKVL